MTSLKWGSATDVGMVRETNQDSFLIADNLYAVADGMGGHAGGEVASATAVEILESSFSGEHDIPSLLEAVRRANAKVWDKAQLDENLHNMGTTLTAVSLLHDEELNREVLAVVNVGDSRGYLLRNDEFTQITKDHSLVEEMMAAGEITAEEAETHPRRNILTRALGVEPTVEVDLERIVPEPGDRILLCSDGLTREIHDDQVAATLRRLKNPDEAAKELVARAKQSGGHDNITVVIVDVEGEPLGAASKSLKKPGKIKLTKAHSPSGRFTFRTFLFFVAILGLIAIAAGSVVWYARASFYVGLEGQQISIYRGRPEPVLWFEPTLAERTNVSVNDVLPNEVARLQAGALQPSREAAHQFVQNLVTEADQAASVADPNAVPGPEVLFDDVTATTTTAVPDTATTAP